VLGDCEVSRRIHIFGASGAGTSTLGRELAHHLGVRHLDADDYYWIKTDPPFTTKRDPKIRVAMIQQELSGLSNWILSGSICGWGDALCSRFTLAVFLSLPAEIRIARLLQRERTRYGARILPGGDMHAQHVEFMDWARAYDEGQAPLRSFDLHEQWMKHLSCPIIRQDSRRSCEELLHEIVERTCA